MNANDLIVAMTNKRVHGNYYACGDNAWGQLGNGSDTQKYISVTKMVNKRFLKVSGGVSASLFLDERHRLFSSGSNYYGTLGIGVGRETVEESRFLLDVMPQKRWIDISCNGTTAAAIDENGVLWTWGNNGFGQLGNGTRTNSCSPINTGIQNCKSVWCAGNSVFVLKNDGTIYGTGYNYYGDLGIGNTSTPVTTFTKANTSVAFASLGKFSAESGFAITPDGYLYGWGRNDTYQLGVGNTTQRNSPVKIGTKKWKQVTSSLYATAAIDSNNQIYTWGNGLLLGVGDMDKNQTTPQLLTSVSSISFKSVSSEHNHCVALDNAGRYFGWGENISGEIGNGITPGLSVYVLTPSMVNPGPFTYGFAGERDTYLLTE